MQSSQGRLIPSVQRQAMKCFLPEAGLLFDYKTPIEGQKEKKNKQNCAHYLMCSGAQLEETRLKNPWVSTRKACRSSVTDSHSVLLLFSQVSSSAAWRLKCRGRHSESISTLSSPSVLKLFLGILATVFFSSDEKTAGPNAEKPHMC